MKACHATAGRRAAQNFCTSGTLSFGVTSEKKTGSELWAYLAALEAGFLLKGCSLSYRNKESEALLFTIDPYIFW